MSSYATPAATLTREIAFSMLNREFSRSAAATLVVGHVVYGEAAKGWFDGEAITVTDYGMLTLYVDMALRAEGLA